MNAPGNADGTFQNHHLVDGRLALPPFTVLYRIHSSRPSCKGFLCFLSQEAGGLSGGTDNSKMFQIWQIGLYPLHLKPCLSKHGPNSAALTSHTSLVDIPAHGKLRHEHLQLSGSLEYVVIQATHLWPSKWVAEEYVPVLCPHKLHSDSS